MAIKISDRLVTESFEKAYYVSKIKNKFLKKIIKIINIFFLKKSRKIQFYVLLFLANSYTFIKCLLTQKKNSPHDLIIFKKITEEQIIFFQKNGWLFIENFLNKDEYNVLNKSWPSNFFFKFKNNPIKYYLWGFEYIKRNGIAFYENNDKKKLSLFPLLEKIYHTILSQSFSKYVGRLFSDNFHFECVSINCTSAQEGAYLIPHIDSIAEDNNEEITLNFIHFIDGNDQDIEYSGGTGIFKDNEFKEKIIIPKTLKNSLLVYNSKFVFYHGFKRMNKNNFRKAIAFQFFKR